MRIEHRLKSLFPAEKPMSAHPARRKQIEAQPALKEHNFEHNSLQSCLGMKNERSVHFRVHEQGFSGRNEEIRSGFSATF